MKKLYLYFAALLSTGVSSQSILNQAETGSRTVSDPQVVVLAPGFNAKSSISNPFIAKIGAPTDNPTNPTDSQAGNDNISTIDVPPNKSFHDTRGIIDVNGGQLQYTLPIALPPGIKSVIPQINLIYTSGSGYGIAGYGWSISGITSISRVGRNIDKDGEVKGIKFDYTDYYTFNGQRLILKSGEYGKDGAEYVTDKFSNTKIKSVGIYNSGPQYWEVTFEDGSQAWYGTTSTGESSQARTPLEYNIVKWKDAQGNFITYDYWQPSFSLENQNNMTALISSIKWGGNETLSKDHFNEIKFDYVPRSFVEQSYINGRHFMQSELLDIITVKTNIDATPKTFKRYEIKYKKQGTNYDFVDFITEINSNEESANSVVFTYPQNLQGEPEVVPIPNSDPFENVKFTGDFNGDSYLDFVMNNGAIKLGAFNDNFTIIPTNKYFGSDSEVVNTLIDTDGSVFNGNGIIQIENSNKLAGYIFKNNNFQKVFEKQIFENPCTTIFPNVWKCIIDIKLNQGDLNGDGISDAFITAKANITDYYPCDNGIDSSGKSAPPGDSCLRTDVYNIGNFIVDLKNPNNPVATYTNDTGVSEGIYTNQKYMDLDGDGKIEIINITNSKWTILDFVKTETNQYLKKVRVSSDLAQTKGNDFPVLYGDYNGDGKIDFAIPTANQSYNWQFYIGTGYGFTSFTKNNFVYYRDPVENNTSNGKNYYRYIYSVSDLNKDGKSDIVYVYTYSEISAASGYKGRNYGFVVSPKIVNNIQSNGVIDFINAQGYTSQKWYANGIDNFNIFRPITNPIKSNNNYYNIFLYSDDKQFKIKAPTPLSELARIQTIKQGYLTTNVEYKELVPDSSNFYINPTKEVYPYVSFDRMNNTFFVSKLSTGYIGEKKQSFKYRGFTVHLAGKGTLGFRRQAHSSWYTDDLINTIVWSGIETIPQNEALPIKEWTVKTASDNNLIFPTDFTSSIPELLSYKETQYQTDILANAVKAIVPTKILTEDFIKKVSSESEIIYGSYYLPAQTRTKINNNFATSLTTMAYLHNPIGIGKDYYIGRVSSQVKTTTAYQSTDKVANFYTYSNNLLQNKTTIVGDEFDNNISEEYLYDGFGNITQKTILSSDGQSKKIKTEYEPKGRFVSKTIDNLNLETTMVYNDWGLLESQTDPFGVVTTNTYDYWGKILTSRNNLSGQTTYSYYRDFGNSDVLGGYTIPKIVFKEVNSDGSTKEEYVNAYDQKYLIRTKVFGQNNFANQSFQHDAIGRKIKESEPYYDYVAPLWNTIFYDDTGITTKVTTTSFNGKQVKTSTNERTTTAEELNGNQRITSQTSDPLGNVIISTDKGGTINFSYNASGKQTKAQYDTNVVTIKYDDWGRKIEFNDPSNGTYTYAYDGFGQILKETSPKGYKQYTYNSFGQLATQKELSNDNTSTNKNITYTYNSKGLITSKAGTANGKAYSSTVNYDDYGRVISTSENSNGKFFMKKGIIYDETMRVTSYEKSLYSSGQYTKVVIENVYDSWSGELYQVKDKTQNKILWELQNTEADGRVLSAKLGGTTIANSYDSANFLKTTTHNNSTSSAMFFKMSYTFDALKNELTYRKREGGLGVIEEYFDYDDNNRLKNWTDPVTGIKPQDIRNTYDIKGRIINNDQVGEIKFANSNKVYQSTGMVLNTAGQQNFNQNLLQKITYNENNDPIFIDGMKGDVVFTYGLTSMRQTATYGGNFGKDGAGKFTKYYSEDGSYEIVRNNQTGQEKHILYIGGTPYDSNIIYLKDYTQGNGSYKFLHKDYLGSILAISDEAGNAIEQRHYDAWGQFTHLKVGSQSMIVGAQQVTDYLVNNSLLLDRGYTSHEHFSEVGLIHMNGRLYDPLLRRFLNADENIQDIFNTQNYNKYGYVVNNPMVYMDPSGEFIWMAVGFVVGAYMTGVQANGGWNPTKWNWGQTWGKIVMGGAIGAVGGVVGAQAGLAAMTASGFTGGVIGGAIAGSVGGAVGGAISGLGNSVMFGGNPITGTLTGALSGAVMGGVVGGVAGGIGTLWNNSKVTDPLLRNNIWTNERVVAGRSPWAFNNIEKPTTTIGKIKILQAGELESELIKDSPKLNLKNCVDCENPRFIFDSKGRGLDLEYFNNLTENSNSSIISGGKGGQNIVNMSGPPNSYTNLNNGHIVVYGPEGKPIFDINAYRVKGIFYNTTPSGKVIPSFGNSTKFNGPTPKSLIDFFGL